jgi:hypothetical protein
MGERENRDYTIIAIAVCDASPLLSFRWSEATRRKVLFTPYAHKKSNLMPLFYCYINEKILQYPF